MQETQAPAPRQAASEHPIRFTGSGSEYFRIWIVNLLLSILTLGIYSAWAKVRRLKYFYGNTLIADSPLDYHGTPLAILKGRIVAVVLLAFWTGIQQFGSPILVGVVLVCGLVIMPWLLVRSLRFQFINTSYRGVRFGFLGGVGTAYAVFALLPFLSFMTGGLLGPLSHQQSRKYLHEGVRYGNLPGSMLAEAGAFYLVYVFTMLIVVGGLVGAFLVVMAIPGLLQAAMGLVPGGNSTLGLSILAMVVVAALAAMLVFVLVAGPYWIVRIRNLVWNHSRIGEHQIRSRAKVWPFIWITVSNFVLILLTVGLFIPFAQIRKARYLVQTMALVPHGSLDEVVATQQDRVSAVGQETADLFDIDIAL